MAIQKKKKKKKGFSIMVNSYVMHRSCSFVFCMDDLKLVDVALTLGVDIDVNFDSKVIEGTISNLGKM